MSIPWNVFFPIHYDQSKQPTTEIQGEPTQQILPRKKEWCKNFLNNKMVTSWSFNIYCSVQSTFSYFLRFSKFEFHQFVSIIQNHSKLTHVWPISSWISPSSLWNLKETTLNFTIKLLDHVGSCCHWCQRIDVKGTMSCHSILM